MLGRSRPMEMVQAENAGSFCAPWERTGHRGPTDGPLYETKDQALLLKGQVAHPPAVRVERQLVFPLLLHSRRSFEKPSAQSESDFVPFFRQLLEPTINGTHTIKSSFSYGSLSKSGNIARLLTFVPWIFPMATASGSWGSKDFFNGSENVQLRSQAISTTSQPTLLSTHPSSSTHVPS